MQTLLECLVKPPGPSGCEQESNGFRVINERVVNATDRVRIRPACPVVVRCPPCGLSERGEWGHRPVHRVAGNPAGGRPPGSGGSGCGTRCPVGPQGVGGAGSAVRAVLVRAADRVLRGWGLNALTGFLPHVTVG
ncbi:hypothetical protein GCM10008961_38700 [Deinococcus knuensis]|uniref:Transposase n=1 Tax=Deinococcus knuensis TaxID=1837380 RepID=A0ABQ2T0H5_9DEIO|nr:hypothetical protein GCM10008961_38700 [Deinococcus knuensis]